MVLSQRQNLTFTQLAKSVLLLHSPWLYRGYEYDEKFKDRLQVTSLDICTKLLRISQQSTNILRDHAIANQIKKLTITVTCSYLETFQIKSWALLLIGQLHTIVICFFSQGCHSYSALVGAINFFCLIDQQVVFRRLFHHRNCTVCTLKYKL